MNCFRLSLPVLALPITLFSVSDKVVKFLYDAGFPHVIQALEPDGGYFFNCAEPHPFIKRNGPLDVFE